MAIKNYDTDRAKKTLYVTGFNPKLINKRLLEELFTQGAPVKDITLFDTHAYVLFHHEESVSYCLALFNEIELHGQQLRIQPRHRSKNAFYHMKYLGQVRDKIMTDNIKVPPPQLPSKESPEKPKNRHDHKRSAKQTKQLKQTKQTKKTQRFKSKGKNKIKRSR